MALTQILTTDAVTNTVVNTKIVDPANTHIGDTVAHVTAGDKTEWNGKAERYEFTASVTTTWVGASAPYTQAVTVTGILADDDPIINPVYSATNATAILEKAAWSAVGKVETTLNTITLTCFEEKPITAFNLQLLVVR